MADFITTDGRTFVMTPPTANGVTTIDGYMFVGAPYITCAMKWIELHSKPDYKPFPPVTAISTSVTVSGDVKDI